MQIKKIAVWGLPFWRSRFIEQIAIINNSEIIKYRAPDSRENSDFICCEILSETVTVRFTTIHGAFLYETTAYQELFKDIDYIIYIVSGVLPKDNSAFVAGGLEDQQIDFRRLMWYVHDNKVTWYHIPWIWLCLQTIPNIYKSKVIDVISYNPLEDIIPAEHPILSCDIDSKVEMQQVSQRLIEIVQNRIKA